MELYVARDEDGELYLYDRKPKRYLMTFNIEHGFVIPLMNEFLPEITWENSPQQVILKPRQKPK